LKIKLVALTLIAFVCWLVPLKTLAQETYKPKPKEEPKVGPTITILPPDAPIKTIQTKVIPTVERKPSSLEVRRDSSTYNGKRYSKDEVQQLIRDYSAQYGIPAEVPLCVARLESGFNQFSKNKTSTASGVFQYLASTWQATDEGKLGYSVFDAAANVRAAVKYMAIHKSVRPWVVWPNCPSLN
jgi:hypothetical protein